MDFDLSEDQVALQGAARELLDDLASPERVRAHVTSGEAFDARLWSAMVDQGWLALEADQSDDGLGLGTVELAVLLEEVGRHVAPVPLLPTLLAADALAAAGDSRASALRRGEMIGCVAWSKQPIQASAENDVWALHGRADPTIAGPVADVAVVLGDADGVPGVFAVDLAAVDRAREPAMDLTRALAWIHFDGLAATRIGGADEAARLLDRAAALTGAEMLGAADHVLAMSTEYAKERVQFDRPIGSFQAVKHRCADMLVDVEGMRSVVYWAAWAIAADDDASIAASTAKTWCSDASKRVMASGLQVHGGIGFTWEHDLHFFLKRAQLDQVAFGTASYHRDRLARLLRPRVEAGESVV